MRPPRSRPGAVRDAVLLICGLAGVAHQELLTQHERPYLLAIYLSMMGLSAGLEDLVRLLRGSRDKDEEGE
jgi:hypothetical protein